MSFLPLLLLLCVSGSPVPDGHGHHFPPVKPPLPHATDPPKPQAQAQVHPVEDVGGWLSLTPVHTPPPSLVALELAECMAATSCGACIERAACGWCGGKHSRCLAGKEEGPDSADPNLAGCASSGLWYYGDCEWAEPAAVLQAAQQAAESAMHAARLSPGTSRTPPPRHMRQNPIQNQQQQQDTKAQHAQPQQSKTLPRVENAPLVAVFDSGSATADNPQRPLIIVDQEKEQDIPPQPDKRQPSDARAAGTPVAPGSDSGGSTGSSAQRPRSAGGQQDVLTELSTATAASSASPRSPHKHTKHRHHNKRLGDGGGGGVDNVMEAEARRSREIDDLIALAEQDQALLLSARK